MTGLSFYKKVLTSDDEYWIISESHSDSHNNRQDDHIYLIVIPATIRRNIKYEEITLSELEEFQRSYMEGNIPLSQSYPPFQRGISFYNVYEGFPITKNVREVMIEALKLKSNSLWDYKKIIDEHSEPKTDINGL